MNGSVTVEKNWADNILDYLRDPASNAWLAYLSGVSPALGNVGIVLGLLITTFMISFTVTDILVNKDGSLAKKGRLIGSYPTIQALEIYIGVIGSKAPASFVATLIINALYLELLGAIMQECIQHEGG